MKNTQFFYVEKEKKNRDRKQELLYKENAPDSLLIREVGKHVPLGDNTMLEEILLFKGTVARDYYPLGSQ